MYEDHMDKAIILEISVGGPVHAYATWIRDVYRIKYFNRIRGDFQLT